MSYYAEAVGERIWNRAASIAATPVTEPVDDENLIMNMKTPVRDFKAEPVFRNGSTSLKTDFSAFGGANVEI